MSKKLKEFIDENRWVMSEYYEILEARIEEDNFKKALEDLIKKDKFFLDPYLELANMCKKSKEKRVEYICLAYENALKIITNSRGKLPDLLEWGFLENRHILRALMSMAILYYEDGFCQNALELFQKILKFNPSDNTGARYYILAILEQLKLEEFNRHFDKDGYWDQQIDIWFNQKAKKYPKEFKSFNIF